MRMWMTSFFIIYQHGASRKMRIEKWLLGYLDLNIKVLNLGNQGVSC